MKFKSALLQAGAIAAVAALGVVVLVASVGGQEGGSVVVRPTPTRTAEETSALSDRLNAEDAAANKAIADDFIQSGRSVKDLQHGGTTADRFDPPLALDAALDAASTVAVGVVKDQILTWGFDRRYKVEGPYLVSLLETERGETLRVAQPAGISRPGAGVVDLIGDGLLEPGLSYAILASPPSSTSVPELIRGHSIS